MIGYVLPLAALLAAPFQDGLICTHRDTLKRVDRIMRLEWKDARPQLILTEIDMFGHPAESWSYKVSSVSHDPKFKATVFLNEKQIPGCDTGSGLQDAVYVSDPSDPDAFARGKTTTQAVMVSCDTYDWTRYRQGFVCKTASR